MSINIIRFARSLGVALLPDTTGAVAEVVFLKQCRQSKTMTAPATAQPLSAI
jgi:hypothetical protein